MLVGWSVDLQAAVLLTLQLQAFVNISMVHFYLHPLGIWVISCNPMTHFNLDSNKKHFIWPSVCFFFTNTHYVNVHVNIMASF